MSLWIPIRPFVASRSAPAVRGEHRSFVTVGHPFAATISSPRHHLVAGDDAISLQVSLPNSTDFVDFANLAPKQSASFDGCQHCQAPGSSMISLSVPSRFSEDVRLHPAVEPLTHKTARLTFSYRTGLSREALQMNPRCSCLHKI